MLPISNGNSRRRLLITIIAGILLAGFIITNAVGFYHLKNSLRETIVETELPKASIEAYSEISQGVLPAIVASSMLANDRFIKKWLADGENSIGELTSYLSSVKNNNQSLIAFLVSANTHQYYNSEGIAVIEEEGDPQADWYFSFRNSGRPYELNLGPNIDDSHTPTIFINYRMEDEGRFIGVVGLGIKLSIIRKILDRYQKNYRQNIYFVSPEGEIILRSEGGKMASQDLDGIPGMNRELSQVPDNATSTFSYTKGADEFYLKLKFIPELKWWMVIEQEEGITFHEVKSILYTNTFIGLGTILITLVLVSWVINYFHKQLELLATKDGLTGVDNRKTFEHSVSKALSRSGRSHTPFSVLLLDVDRFKDINDQHGHLTGDLALQAIAGILSDTIRKSDNIGRWGGEEFVILAHNTSIQSAEVLAEKIRSRVAQCKTLPQQITISIGVTQAAYGDGLDTLIHRADMALYKAKSDGRNCVRVRTVETPVSV